MPADKDFNNLSYDKHDRNYQVYAAGSEKENLAKTWFNEETVDAWHHRRMHNLLDPLFEMFPEASWLTVGDGRCGSDAHYVQSKVLNVLATDISEILLKEAKEAGYIKKYKKENAEFLSFPDREFDFVLCKESYHHFPRPAVALYEMLRVAKKGVVLIEPNDNYVLSSSVAILFRNFKDLIKRVLGKKVVRHSFEEVGNYCYTISKREIEKLALGMNFKAVVFKGIHSYYLNGEEYEKTASNGKLFKKIKRRIALYDLLTKLGVQQHAVLMAVIFKEKISSEFEKKLNNDGYEVVMLPDNPY